VAEKPAVNPNVDDIADQAKYRYANGTKLLAATQYRLAELAGSGRLDPDESMSLQENLFHIWQALYAGTLCAVRDDDTDDSSWHETDNTYSDGRQVMIQIRIEPWETPECHWEHNRFLLDEGSVKEHLRGAICFISPINPQDDHQVVDLGDEADPTDSDAEDG
jgi:hypothetical protein